MHGYSTHEEAMAQTNSSVATDAETWRMDEREARRLLEEIPSSPPPSTDSVWYVVLPGEGQCQTLQDATGVSYPAEVMDLFASEGNPLDVLHYDGSSFLVRQVNNPEEGRLLFVMGEPRCRIFLAGVMAH